MSKMLEEQGFFSRFKNLVFVATFLFSVLLFTSSAHANPKYASIVMDADTGQILHQRYANKRLHPASLTKVMTLMMLFEELERGRVRLSDRIYISSHAASMVPSKLGLEAGSSIRVRDAIYILITKSANDIAVAVAERLGGSEARFAQMMTRRAREIGMKRTVFRNASGLHHKGQVTTAADMARMARYVINEHPQYYRYFSRENFTYQGKTYRSHNRLMSSYKGMDGMKTGYIRASGFNLIASAVRDNRRIIGVVFGGRTSKSRNAHMASLLDRSFTKLSEIRIARGDAPVPAPKPQALAAAIAMRQLDKPAEPLMAHSIGEIKFASAQAELKTGMLHQMIGEGDYDPSVSRRLETGLIAMTAHRGKAIPASLTKEPAGLGDDVVQALSDSLQAGQWAIQIGAFKKRQFTHKILDKTLDTLPKQYADARPVIVPVKTEQGWLYRARLMGYTQSQASDICKLLHSCMPIAP